MPTVVSLGIHILDVLGRPVAAVPPGQGLALLDQIRFTAAGTAAGASVDMAKLGLEVVAMGAVGQDEIGDFLISLLGRHGVNTASLRRKPGCQTSATILPIRPNGERPALHVIGANGEFTAEDVDFEVLRRARILHVGGAPLMPKFDGKPAGRVLRFAREHGITTTFDVLGLPRAGWVEEITCCLPEIDYFMPNAEEAAMLSGLERPREQMRSFLDGGARHVVLKRGAEGSLIGFYEPNGQLAEVRTPAFQVPVVDSTGCGDAWNAGFIKGLSMGWDLPDAARLGCACGGLVIQGLGSDAGIVDFDQVMDFAARTPARS